jgi:hypothetical protein
MTYLYLTGFTKELKELSVEHIGSQLFDFLLRGIGHAVTKNAN